MPDRSRSVQEPGFRTRGKPADSTDGATGTRRVAGSVGASGIQPGSGRVKVGGNMETQETPNICSVCGQSFDSEDELRSHEAEQHAETGGEQLGDNWDGEQHGADGPGEGMGRGQGGGVAGG